MAATADKLYFPTIGLSWWPCVVRLRLQPFDTGIEVSNPAEDMDVDILFCCWLCSYRLLRQSDPSFRGVLPCVRVSNCV